jgi:hypothetical protein
MSLEVNLGISSILGVKRSTRRLEGPRPIVQTTKTLNGETFPDEGMTLETRVLVIDPIPEYNIRFENTSTAQTVSLTNFGNSTLTVVLPVLASSDGVDPVFTYNPADELAGEIVIDPGTTSTFQLAYYGRTLGTWTNALLFVTDTDIGNYKVTTNQTVSNMYEFEIIPNQTTSTITTYARAQLTDFTIVPYQGVTESISASLSGDPGYSLISFNTTTITVQFDPNVVLNTSGIYTSTLTVVANSLTQYATLTTYLSITPGDYANYGTWFSPVSYYNSVIGVSYDRIDGRRTVTIGIGTGGNGVNEYTEGGAAFANIGALGISGDELDPKYPYWACVFRIPVNEDGDTTPRTYFSGAFDFDGNRAYLDKFVEGNDYFEYFGDYASQGSMFIVRDDGNGNIEIDMNRLRELSDDPRFNTTLQNLSRAFYYYSGVDTPSRYPDDTGNLELLPFNPAGDYMTSGNLTKLFRGFLRNGAVVTSWVDIPV